ncbi:MarR family transcriptional regulator [soil metagenome]
MSSSYSNRAGLLEALHRALRISTAQGAIFAEEVAKSAGINSTDMECLDILYLHGPVTAGQLAELTGLSTGAITGLVDRLEKAGYARRERDLDDRRKVIVHLNTEKARPNIGSLYGSMSQAMIDLHETYSNDELALVLDFITRSGEVMHAETAKLREKIASR